MLKSRTRWMMRPVDEDKVRALAGAINVPPIIARLLVSRGMEDAAQAALFLHPEKIGFHDPMLLDGMAAAVKRIRQAILNKEKIVVFGDYDADGVTSTSLLVRALAQMGADVSFYIPDRFKEGYGPNEPALAKVKQDGAELVVTVDTGIAAAGEAAYAASIGLDYIVTDHHEPPAVLPEGCAVIDPKKKTCTYPFKGLSGAGVALKLVQALMGGDVPHALFSLAAIGTIADLVPLVDENRLIAAKGLSEIESGTFCGVDALVKKCGHGKKIDSDLVGFHLAPRLNAAGRMAHANTAVRLLLTDDEAEAETLAEELNQLNTERKALVDTIAAEAEKQAVIAAAKHQKAFVIAGVGWHQGVIGIVASRIVGMFYRPTVILSIDLETGLAKGSARSIDGFNLYQALAECSGCLEQFGGHEMAAGMTLVKDNIPAFRLRLNQAAEAVLDERALTPVQWIDSRCEAGEATVELIDQFERFAPFGMANPKPVFQLTAAPFVSAKTVGQNGDHLKMVFKGHAANLDGIGFGLGAKAAELAADDDVSAVGELGVNEWNGFRKPQLFICDLKVDGWQLFDWRHEQKLREKILRLPGDKTTLLAFHPETTEDIGLQDIEEALTIYDADGPKMKTDLVLLDLPDDLSQLEELLAANPGIGRIYAVFHHSTEHFFSAFPTREHFKWYYAVIRRQQSFRLSPMLKQIARYKGWQMETVRFMTKVFFELDFVKIEGDVLISNAAPRKTPLTASETYRKQLNQMQLEEKLCYSSLSSLKAWFNEKRQGECPPAEEKTVHGL